MEENFLSCWRVLKKQESVTKGMPKSGENRMGFSLLGPTLTDFRKSTTLWPGFSFYCPKSFLEWIGGREKVSKSSLKKKKSIYLSRYKTGLCSRMINKELANTENFNGVRLGDCNFWMVTGQVLKFFWGSKLGVMPKFESWWKNKWYLIFFHL